MTYADLTVDMFCGLVVGFIALLFCIRIKQNIKCLEVESSD